MVTWTAINATFAHLAWIFQPLRTVIINQYPIAHPTPSIAKTLQIMIGNGTLMAFMFRLRILFGMTMQRLLSSRQICATDPYCGFDVLRSCQIPVSQDVRLVAHRLMKNCKRF
jgi:hypothetical protein